MSEVEIGDSRRGLGFARLMGVGGYRGSRVVDNDELCMQIDSTDEWILKRTGIARRSWATPEESPLSMAVEASRKAIERSGISVDDIDTVIVATVSHFKQTPSLACDVARLLGCHHPAAFDISAACAGFCYAVGIGDSLVKTGTSRHVLAVGVETLSRFTDVNDRSTAPLFGDGAGAAIVGQSSQPAIGPLVWGSDPSRSDVIFTDDWLDDHRNRLMPTIHMQGQEVYKWATRNIANKATEILEASGLTPDDIDVFIPHQANDRITDTLVRRMGLSERVVVARDIKNTGNSSAASIPLAMESLLDSGQAASGQTALLIAFGAGMVFAGQTVVLP